MTATPAPKTQFASDNTAGICPEAWDALARANRDYASSYGTDAWTERAADLLREIFETDKAEVFFVFNGTAANSLALASCCQSYHSVICHEHAHIVDDECGAPEFFSNGTKLLGAPGEHGKITPAEIARIASKRTDIHYPKPRVVSLTQSTELGTVYQTGELEAIRETARSFGLVMHLDGARFANAVASLGKAPKAVSWQAGVDVLCFGGTKLGLANCEAVVFFNRDLAREFDYRCKQAGQLASKMRFLAAGWVGVLENGAWLKHALHANRCAALLAARMEKEAGLAAAHPVEANAAFIPLPENIAKGLRDRGWRVYNFIGGNAVRFMCSWRTTEADIDALLADVKEIRNVG
ncbi:MAG TPA: low specificity L-threonine aldolase [Candidatus Methylacidiphilales bacterium]|jgi:threonine aldolase|nr:low specificity L-threonine aldolase [Candidatus Methylacidiphilales bacterium]